MATQYEKRQKVKKDDESTDGSDTIPVELDRDAWDFFRHDVTNEYMRVEISYNLETGEAKVKEIKKIADSQPTAIHKVKELFSRKLFKIAYK